MESAVQTLVGSVGKLLREEYHLLSNVGIEVAELRDELATMNALLRMQVEADEGVVDHFVRECMKQVRDLAFDAEDCIDEYVFSISFKASPKDGVRDLLKHLLATLFPRRRLAGEISDLRARAITISERRMRYSASHDALRRRRRRLPSLPTPAAPVMASSSSAHVPGNDNDPGHHQVPFINNYGLYSLVERLKAQVHEERNLEVFSIVGIGGIGKTKLAMEACRRLEPEFPYQAMVSVSQSFNPKTDLEPLLKRVLQQVVEEEGTLGGIDGLAEKLRTFLEGKRYLIVIDDIWTIAAWDAIRPYLPENKCGSRIIITTRIEAVARACSPANQSGDCILRVDLLNLQDSKRLFLSTAFGSVMASYPEELEDVMHRILEKCCGLPLAITSIASILRCYRSPRNKDKWEAICNTLGSQMEMSDFQGLRQIITLSYKALHSDLQGYFMYCSIFPEDCVISKDRFLYRCIAEGLVEEKEGLTMLEVAETYLDELLARSLIHSVSFGYDERVESFRLHDLVLDMLQSESQENYFVTLVSGRYKVPPYGRTRRLSIHQDEESGAHSTNHGIQGVRGRNIRSLSLFGPKRHKLLDELGNFTLLRVLDLEGCEELTKKDARSVFRMYLLRFLSLRHTNISVVPPQVEKLKYLQTFDVRDTDLGGLPESVTKLQKLERLLFSNRHERNKMWRLPPGLRKMKALQKVSSAVLKNDVQVAREVGELEHLQELDIFVDSIEGDAVHEFALSLSNLYSLRRLNIEDTGGNGKKTINFLHELPSPPRLLRYLRMAVGIDALPTWIGSLTHLVEFVISDADLTGDQLFDTVCNLPNLKSIWMQQMWCSEELVARSSHKFPLLINLKVTSDSVNPRVIRFEGGSMSKLERLEVRFADKGRRIDGIQYLTNLKEVRLTGKNDNHALHLAREQLKAESEGQPRSNQFKVVVKDE